MEKTKSWKYACIKSFPWTLTIGPQFLRQSCLKFFERVFMGKKKTWSSKLRQSTKKNITGPLFHNFWRRPKNSSDPKPTFVYIFFVWNQPLENQQQGRGGKGPKPATELRRPIQLDLLRHPVLRPVVVVSHVLSKPGKGWHKEYSGERKGLNNFREVQDEGSMVQQCIQCCEVHKTHDFFIKGRLPGSSKKSHVTLKACRLDLQTFRLFILMHTAFMWTATRDRMQHIPPMENASLQNISKVQKRRPKNLRQVQKFTQFTWVLRFFLPYKMMLC